MPLVINEEQQLLKTAAKDFLKENSIILINRGSGLVRH